MSGAPRPPRLARWLLRLRPLGSRRAEIEADLEELYARRAAAGGSLLAAWGYCRDVLSLWRCNLTGTRLVHDAAHVPTRRAARLDAVAVLRQS